MTGPPSASFAWTAVLTAAGCWLVGGTVILIILRCSRTACARTRPADAAADGAGGAERCLDRAHFERRLDAEIRSAGRSGAPLALTVFRIDNVEEIARFLGESGVELAMERVAWAVSSRGRPADAVGRLGRATCGVIMPHVDPGQADAVSRSMRDAVSGAYLLLGQIDPVPFEVSVRVAHCPDHGRTAGELIRSAEAALGHAEGAGRP